MFTKILPKKTQETLELLGKGALLRDFYLSGGTACALYLGHRLSEDLDFFTPTAFKTQKLKHGLATLKPLKILSEDKNTLHGIINHTRISLLFYPYPTIQPFSHLHDLKISSLLDVLCTKLDTISSRGSKKDFIDLYSALQKKKYSLPYIIKAFQKKYHGIDYNLVHILKGLIYFENADGEALPVMIDTINWQNVKEFFIKEVRKHEKRLR